MASKRQVFLIARYWDYSAWIEHIMENDRVIEDHFQNLVTGGSLTYLVDMNDDGNKGVFPLPNITGDKSFGIIR